MHPSRTYSKKDIFIVIYLLCVLPFILLGMTLAGIRAGVIAGFNGMENWIDSWD